MMPELRDISPMVWIVDADWRVLESDEKRACRRCKKPASAVLYRRYHGGLPRPWAYCHEHMYGRQIISGVVHVQVCAESRAARRGYVLYAGRWND